MSNDRKIYKPKPISGFPEWLPEERLVEQKWFDHIRNVFESYGFCSIETPSVEEIDVLTAKGEVDKEIYVVERLHKDESDSKEARLALHFDQTVPFARYVAMRFNDLVFPFKRYQIQRVWRGERPQAGRFREFYQCDIDVIGVDALPMHFDAEMPAVMWEILTGLPGMEDEKIQMQISNRKVLLGLLSHIGAKEAVKYTTFIDKMEKIGRDAVIKGLKDCLQVDGLNHDLSEKILKLASIKTSDANVLRSTIAELDIHDEAFHEGVEELAFVLDSLKNLPKDSIVADLSIIRGLDYYTGTVYETRFLDDPTYGSICSGGRYDDLAGGYINKHLPGVGISIGFSRLFAKMLEKGKLPVTQKSPADVMMIMPSDERRAEILALCQKMRKNGVKVEMYHAAKKIPDQFEIRQPQRHPLRLVPRRRRPQSQKHGNAGTRPSRPINMEETGMKILALALALLLLSGPAFAAEYNFAPKGCDFHMTFPEQPATGKACDAKDLKDCHLVNTYTKIFDVSTGLRINVTCSPAEKDMLQKYSGKVMQYTLAAMSKEHIDPDSPQTAFEDHGNSKQAILMGSKKQDSGDETVYMSQLWIGPKSVMTLEGEITGPSLPEADTLFAHIMKSVSFTSASPETKTSQDSAASNNAKPVEKPEQKPASKAEKP